MHYAWMPQHTCTTLYREQERVPASPNRGTKCQSIPLQHPKASRFDSLCASCGFSAPSSSPSVSVRPALERERLEALALTGTGLQHLQQVAGSMHINLCSDRVCGTDKKPATPPWIQCLFVILGFLPSSEWPAVSLLALELVPNE